MADADLDVVIRQLASQTTHTGLMTRTKERRDRFNAPRGQGQGQGVQRPLQDDGQGHHGARPPPPPSACRCPPTTSPTATPAPMRLAASAPVATQAGEEGKSRPRRSAAKAEEGEGQEASSVGWAKRGAHHSAPARWMDGGTAQKRLARASDPAISVERALNLLRARRARPWLRCWRARASFARAASRVRAVLAGRQRQRGFEIGARASSAWPRARNARPRSRRACASEGVETDRRVVAQDGAVEIAHGGEREPAAGDRARRAWDHARSPRRNPQSQAPDRRSAGAPAHGRDRREPRLGLRLMASSKSAIARLKSPWRSAIRPRPS